MGSPGAARSHRSPSDRKSGRSRPRTPWARPHPGQPCPKYNVPATAIDTRRGRATQADSKLSTHPVPGPCAAAGACSSAGAGAAAAGTVAIGGVPLPATPPISPPRPYLSKPLRLAPRRCSSTFLRPHARPLASNTTRGRKKDPTRATAHVQLAIRGLAAAAGCLACPQSRRPLACGRWRRGMLPEVRGRARQTRLWRQESHLGRAGVRWCSLLALRVCRRVVHHAPFSRAGCTPS